jgi:hypothetical protein
MQVMTFNSTRTGKLKDAQAKWDARVIKGRDDSCKALGIAEGLIERESAAWQLAAKVRTEVNREYETLDQKPSFISYKKRLQPREILMRTLATELSTLPRLKSPRLPIQLPT